MELLTCYLQLKKVVGILVIMKMVPVMMKITMKPVSLMVEIAVDLMLIQIIAIYVNALKKEEGVVEELQLPDFVIIIGLLMDIVMMSTII